MLTLDIKSSTSGLSDLQYGVPKKKVIFYYSSFVYGLLGYIIYKYIAVMMMHIYEFGQIPQHNYTDWKKVEAGIK